MQMIALQEFSAIAWGIMGLLGLMSAFAASVVLVKLGQFSRAGVGSRRVSRKVAQALEQLNSGSISQALAQVQNARALRLQILGLLLEGSDAQEGGVQAMGQARDGIDALSQHMRGLDAVVQAAPMLGLLGTVVGMIEAFGKLAATSGAADPALLAGGIWTALVTTALGLSIAILFYLLALWLEGRITSEAQALERMIRAVVQMSTLRQATVMADTPSPAPAAHTPSASPFSTRESAHDTPAPSQMRASLAQPLPGSAQLQRTDPGLTQPKQRPGGSDTDAGPPPEGFRTRR